MIAGQYQGLNATSFPAYTPVTCVILEQNPLFNRCLYGCLILKMYASTPKLAKSRMIKAKTISKNKLIESSYPWVS